MMQRNRNRRDAFLEGRLKPTMTFKEAAEEWVKVMNFQPDSDSSRGPKLFGYIARRTLRDYQSCIRALAKHFADTRLTEITPAMLREYQEQRVAGTYTNTRYTKPRHQPGPGAGSAIINKEINLLMRMLRRSKAWTAAMEEGYAPLMSDPADVQRAMTPNEQKHFLEVAQSKTRWHVLYWYSILALQTTMSTNELRGLRLRDFDLNQGVVMVRAASAKNKYRIRTIPLSDESIKAAEWLIARARELGSRAPDHFLFPFRLKRGTCDPTRSMGESGFKGRWEDLRAAAGLDWLRMYDLRHCAITRYAEAGTPIQTIMAMAGHISVKMSLHYTSISEQSKRQAVTRTAALMKAGQKRITASGGSIPQISDAVPVAGVIASLREAGLQSDQILDIIASMQAGKNGEASHAT
jgi:integrase